MDSRVKISYLTNFNSVFDFVIHFSNNCEILLFVIYKNKKLRSEKPLLPKYSFIPVKCLRYSAKRETGCI